MLTERRSKRLRPSPPPTPDDARHRYLDTIPDDILRLVLRHMSRRPRSRNWRAYTSPLTVHTSLEVGGALARAAQLEFRDIGGRNSIPLDMILDAPILRSLVHCLPLHRLVLTLNRQELIPDLLRGCGGELKELALESLDSCSNILTKTIVNAVTIHSKKLTSLELRTTVVEGTLTPIWRTLGATLQHIYLTSYHSPEGRGGLRILSVANMLQYCVNLTRVDVGTLGNRIADVLVALGGRIRVLGLETQREKYDISLWRKVFQSCSNISVVHADLVGSRSVTEVIDIIHSKVHTMKLRTPFPNCPRFANRIAACCMLKEIEFHVETFSQNNIPRQLLESVSSVTKFSCDVSRLHNISPKNDIIEIVARLARSIKSFTISTYDPLRGDDVHELTTLPNLSSVKLRCRFLQKDNMMLSEKYAVEIVDKLRQCDSLEILEIDDVNIKKRSSLIAKAAMNYHRYNFDMFIGGVQYTT